MSLLFKFDNKSVKSIILRMNEAEKNYNDEESFHKDGNF